MATNHFEGNIRSISSRVRRIALTRPDVQNETGTALGLHPEQFPFQIGARRWLRSYSPLHHVHARPSQTLRYRDWAATRQPP